MIGKTAQVWISFMNHIWLVLYLQEAVKNINFYLSANSIDKMADLFFSFGGQNHARSLTYFGSVSGNAPTYNTHKHQTQNHMDRCMSTIDSCHCGMTVKCFPRNWQMFLQIYISTKVKMGKNLKKLALTWMR